MIIYKNYMPSERQGYAVFFCTLIDSSIPGLSDGLPVLNISNLTCKEDFIEQNFTCVPHCDIWDERPMNVLVIIEDYVRITLAILQWILGVALLLVFVIRRKAL